MEQQTAAKPEEGKALAISSATGLVPHSLAEARDIAVLLARSNALPKDYVGQPANILIAVMMGAEVGLSPINAIQNIMVVNNRPSIWGDALMGIVVASPHYEDHRDSYDPKLDEGTVTFEVKRKGKTWKAKTFSVADAKKAGLWGKAGPWTNYPKRMLFMRARAFCLRDTFPDLLKGIRIAEEERDIIEGTLVPEAGAGFPSGPTPAQQAQEVLKEAAPETPPQAAVPPEVKEAAPQAPPKAVAQPVANKPAPKGKKSW